MSEKWEQRGRMIIARKGVAIITIDAVTPKLAHQIVTAVNHDELFKEMEKLVCYTAQVVCFAPDHPTTRKYCGECISCRAKAILAKINKEKEVSKNE